MSAVKKLLSVVSRSDAEEATVAARLAKARKSLAVASDALAVVRADRDLRLRAGEDTEEERGTIASLVAEETALREELEVPEMLHAEAVVRAKADREEAHRGELRAEAEALLPKIRSVRERVIANLDALALAVEEEGRLVTQLVRIADELPGEPVPRPWSVAGLWGVPEYHVRQLTETLRRFRL